MKTSTCFASITDIISSALNITIHIRIRTIDINIVHKHRPYATQAYTHWEKS